MKLILCPLSHSTQQSLTEFRCFADPLEADVFSFSIGLRGSKRSESTSCGSQHLMCLMTASDNKIDAQLRQRKTKVLLRGAQRLTQPRRFCSMYSNFWSSSIRVVDEVTTSSLHFHSPENTMSCQIGTRGALIFCNNVRGTQISYSLLQWGVISGHVWLTSPECQKGRSISQLISQWLSMS